MSHALAREKVCNLCFGKAERKIWPALLEKLKAALPEYAAEIDFDSTVVPSGICNGCYFKLNGKGKVQIAHHNFDFVILSTNADGSCGCQICNVARDTKLKFPRAKR